MAAPTPTAVDIEIVERGRTQGEDGAGLVIPNTVRINGQEVIVPDGHPITIHEISGDAAVCVTLTLFARSITVRAEDGQRLTLRSPETDR